MASRYGCLPQKRGGSLGFMETTDTRATRTIFLYFPLLLSCLITKGMSRASIATVFSVTIGIRACHLADAIKNESKQIAVANAEWGFQFRF
jgi:hypothetical protein